MTPDANVHAVRVWRPIDPMMRKWGIETHYDNAYASATPLRSLTNKAVRDGLFPHTHPLDAQYPSLVYSTQFENTPSSY